MIGWNYRSIVVWISDPQFVHVDMLENYDLQLFSYILIA